MIEYTLEYIKQFEREKKFLADEVPTCSISISFGKNDSKNAVSVCIVF